MAFSRFSPVAGTRPLKKSVMVSSKRMTLKRSAGFSFDMASDRLLRACSIDGPDMEPELSMTKTTSRGEGALAGAVGGVTKARR
ncbi:hypothetical protein D3C87_1967170 [compost metagenome]